MKCGQPGCGQSAEIFNLSNERWECVVHHRTIRSVAASRRARIDIRARREERQKTRQPAAEQTGEGVIRQVLEALDDLQWD